VSSALSAGDVDSASASSSEAEHPAQMRRRVNPAAIRRIAAGYRF
jgi:hypothetical protein